MPPPQSLRPSIYLDYGADAINAADAACEICERGMRFSAQWHFEVGTVLHIAIAFEEGSPCRIEAESLVIECLPIGCCEYLITLAFVEPPPELRALLGKIYPLLAF